MRPTVRSRRLGSRLGTYRQQSGLSGTELAAKIGIHQGTWSKIESGKAKVSPNVLVRTAQALNIPAEVAAQLEALRRKADEPGWWQDYGDILSEAVQMLIELETDASWIRTYEGEVIPGLLQTRDYAERGITAVSPHIRVADVDRYLELRMRRQKRILEGLRLTAVVGEAAIRQQVGGPGILREQLQHITRMVRERDVTVQVVPFTADAHAALGDSFVIIQWPDETDPEAVYVDGVTSWTVHERGGVIRSYLHAFGSVQSQALAPRESLDLIHDVIKDLR
ncbi:helix-turn-helix transcriptional regulator [Amycolatopsis rhizosphaerae]|uniref:Helix-turn-helix transcriptional regulator n=1 Tax=Amycolatopsis rhizosphaerae TaxID=2053003 RepID=A0A558DLJ9_9PSEU|nr:helix-turn-helix transcriptional regulator [Amycolatopsis rhizosphaerae]TVT61897.1 helix-turn-helix transcriptional regulator [Amycolatopsis rhizosphaerae]